MKTVSRVTASRHGSVLPAHLLHYYQHRRAMECWTAFGGLLLSLAASACLCYGGLLK